jgi:hypothetical protein
MQEGENKTDVMVDIHTLLSQLQQLIENADRHGEPSDDLKRQYDEILSYHYETGSHYYPLS